MIRTRWLVLVVGLGGLAVTGCVSQHSGSDLSSAKAQDFKVVPGQTTRAELVAHYGDPMSDMTDASGVERLTWNETKVEGHVNPTAFIPFGFLVTPDASSKSQSKSLSVALRNGVVTEPPATGQTVVAR